jgi:hypothetical protein
MTMSRDGGRARRGDSGSWIYETASGKPFLMLTAMCGMSEGLGITLDEVFSEIKQWCGKSVVLHTPRSKDRYTPTADDHDIRLIGRRRSR